MQFVHLHVHSQYSMLDGAVRIGPLIDRAVALGMPAVAVTDHGNMFGALQFHRACTAAGIKPILGSEVYFTPGRHGDPNDRRAHHLVLLASSQQGYANLVQLVSRGWVEGLRDGVPRIDLPLLEAHHEGVVALTGCMGGWVAQEVLMRGPDAGRSALGVLKDAMSPGHLFVELQDHGLVEQRPLNGVLIELAGAVGLPTVATNDCHYTARQDAKAQLVLQCIAAGRGLAEMEASHHRSDELFLKSGIEMADRFSGCPAAIENTLRVAEMCAGAASPFDKPKLPRFALPEGATEEAYLRDLSAKGLEARFQQLELLGRGPDRAAYASRLALELEVICQMGFAGYFLIVQDFINWAKGAGVPVGPGRGSGAGSLVAWALRITDLDPIPYGLLFERFLNPERVSMPDFDIDFCMDQRDRVINYVREKYGAQSVGQIATFHLLKSRSVVRDVGRVMGMTPAEAGRIATLVPEPVQGKSVSIGKALEQEPRLKAIYGEETSVKALLDTAMTLEDLTRHAGMHAAGVVISEGPLWHHVPVFCPEEGAYVTQYSKDDVEAAGLVKFDFLGLKTLTVIDIATKLINRRPDRRDRPLRIEDLPLDDSATFALLQSGETTNVFQLESSGMQTLFKQLRPDCFEDIVAAVALYRPGPLGSGMVEDFVQRKHGRVRVEYPHPCLEPILKETYGVMVYQEQVMQTAREMAGYSLGGADLLRRAMGKKKPEEMAKQKAIFLEGAKRLGHGEADADRVFELMAYFAGYGFNKSHSAAYALLTYQTAYLKAHYPVEFICATLSSDKDKSEKVVRTVAEGRSMGIVVLPPDVNESDVDFTVVYDMKATSSGRRPKGKPVCHRGKVRDPLNPRIRFGLGAIKGVGGAALEAVFEARNGTEEHPGQQPFVDLFDFGSRVDLRRVNKNVIEALVQSGAFDGMHEDKGVSRAQAFGGIDRAIERGRKLSQERLSGQTNLFGLLSAGHVEGTHPEPTRVEFPVAEAWGRPELLRREKETLGFYVSGHPLDRYVQELARFCDCDTQRLSGLSDGQRVTVGGAVEGYRERTTKAGHKIAFFFLEDSVGRAEVVVRPKVLEAPGVRDVLGRNVPVVVKAMVQYEREGRGEGGEAQVKLVLDEVAPLSETLSDKARGVHVSLAIERTTRTQLETLRATLERYPGDCPVALELTSGREWNVMFASTGLSVAPSEALLEHLERVFGHKVAELR